MTVRRLPFTVTIVLSSVLVFSVFGEVQRAQAQTPVAVLPFEGRGAGGARRQVERALENDGRVVVIEQSRTDGAARGSDPAAVARELGAGLVIDGRVTGRGRRQRVQLRAYDSTGRQIATASGATRGSGIDRAVRSVLDESLPQLPSSTSEQPARDRTSYATPVDEPERVPRIDPSASASSPESDEPEASTSEWDMRAPLLELQVGVVPRSRDADVTFESSRHGRYSAWYTELAARAAFRPFNADPSILRGLYARGFFAHSVALSSKIESCDSESSVNCNVNTSFWRLDFGAGLLFPLADILDLGVEFGAGWDSYALSSNPLLESAQYIYLRPAIRARMRLYREFLVMGAEVGARPVLQRGSFSQYGRNGDSVGFDVGGTIGGGVAFAGNVGMTYGVSVAYVNYWHNFENAAEPALTATSGTDGGLRIELMLGFALW